VQITFLRALTSMEGFQPAHKQAFLAFLRRILMNQIIDLVRKAERRKTSEFHEEVHRAPHPSQLECLLGKEALARYEAAFARLPADKQEAVMMRMELGFTYQKIAMAQGLPSDSAARMKVARALLLLAEVMDGD